MKLDMQLAQILNLTGGCLTLQFHRKYLNEILAEEHFVPPHCKGRSEDPRYGTQMLMYGPDRHNKHTLHKRSPAQVMDFDDSETMHAVLDVVALVMGRVNIYLTPIEMAITPDIIPLNYCLYIARYGTGCTTAENEHLANLQVIWTRESARHGELVVADKKRNEAPLVISQVQDSWRTYFLEPEIAAVQDAMQPPNPDGPTVFMEEAVANQRAAIKPANRQEEREKDFWHETEKGSSRRGGLSANVRPAKYRQKYLEIGRAHV